MAEKFNYPFTFVPTGLVNPKVDNNPFVSTKDLFEHDEESIGITFFLSHHPMFPVDGVNPAKYIESFLIVNNGQ